METNNSYTELTVNEKVNVINKVTELFNSHPYAVCFNRSKIECEFLHYTGMHTVFELKFNDMYKGVGARSHNRYEIYGIIICVSKQSDKYIVDFKGDGTMIPHRKRKEEIISSNVFKVGESLDGLIETGFVKALENIVLKTVF